MCSPLRASLFYGIASLLTEGSGAGASPDRSGRLGKSQKADIRRGGGKKLVWAKTIHGILASGSAKGLYLQKPLSDFWEGGV